MPDEKKIDVVIYTNGTTQKHLRLSKLHAYRVIKENIGRADYVFAFTSVPLEQIVLQHLKHVVIKSVDPLPNEEDDEFRLWDPPKSNHSHFKPDSGPQI